MKRFTRLLILFSLAWGCASALPLASCDKKVPDFTSNEVCIPKRIDKIIITCYGGGSQEIALFMGADKIVAQPDTRQFKMFTKIYPNLKNIPSIGTFNDVNLETLLKLRPTMVFAGVTSSPMNERIRSAGIPLYTLGIGKHSIPTLLQEFSRVGAILRKEQKANELIGYWNQTLSSIDKRLSRIDPSKRKRVFYTSTSGKISTDGPKSWSEEFIEAAGGINVAKEITVQGSVNPEILNLWNPDVIITTTNAKSMFNAEKIRKDPALKHLKAVRGQKVFSSPVGTFWWDRPSPESILGILWLSKTLYPKELADIDLKYETKRFYKRFYGYDLSDIEYKLLFKHSTISKDRQ